MAILGRDCEPVVTRTACPATPPTRRERYIEAAVTELEGLIRDKLPDPVRRHLTEVHIDRVDAEGFRANWAQSI